MNLYCVGEILFPVKWVVQSSKRSAAPGWQTGGGSRPDEIDLCLVRHWAERHEAMIRRTVAMLDSNRCMSR
jgi:hypothetical protein